MDTKLNTPILGIINSDNLDDIHLLEIWIKQMDKIIINGKIVLPFLEVLKSQNNVNDQEIFIVRNNTKINDLLSSNKLVFSSQLFLQEDESKTLSKTNLKNETIQEFAKYIKESKTIVWFGCKIFDNPNTMPEINKLLKLTIQCKKNQKFICDIDTYLSIKDFDNIQNCFYVKEDKQNEFLNHLKIKTNDLISINSETASSLLDKEINENTSVIKVPKKVIKLTKKESRKKRKWNEEATIKNQPGYVIEINDLSKNYVSGGNKITRVLKNLNLKIKQGEFIVLFGKSGSGKSTLLNIISGLDRPTSGNVIVMDHNLPYLSTNQLTKFRRDYLSFIFQQYHLLNNITGFENVETGLYLNKKNNAKNNEFIETMFKKFDLADAMNKFPSQMSGGQQQRISIMRALSKDADIIFADEPTGALDKKTSTIVLDMLKDVNRNFNKTIVMVSHDPSVTKYATRVVTLDKGIIIKDDIV